MARRSSVEDVRRLDVHVQPACLLVQMLEPSAHLLQDREPLPLVDGAILLDDGGEAVWHQRQDDEGRRHTRHAVKQHLREAGVRGGPLSERAVHLGLLARVDFGLEHLGRVHPSVGDVLHLIHAAERALANSRCNPEPFC